MDLHAFLKQNKKAGEKEELYVVSKAFVDEKGEPIPWKFRAISSEEFNQIRKRCTKMVQIPGKNQFRQDMDTDLLNNILIARCTVEPDLQNDELLRSYGVASPEELIPEMSQGEHSNIGTVFFAVGFTVMMMLDVALG